MQIDDTLRIGKEKALYVCRKMLPEIVYNMAALEGSTLSNIETSLICEGLSVGGKTLQEVFQAVHIKNAWEHMMGLVAQERFTIDKKLFISLNNIVAVGENPSIGNFRHHSVLIQGSVYQPPIPLALDNLFTDMMSTFNAEDGRNILQKGYDLFLDASKNQYFGDGNKRTAQIVASGFFMSNGYPLLSIAASQKNEFLQGMVEFYERGNRERIYETLGKQQARIAMEPDGSRLSEQKKRKIEALFERSEKKTGKSELKEKNRSSLQRPWRGTLKESLPILIMTRYQQVLLKVRITKSKLCKEKLMDTEILIFISSKLWLFMRQSTL